MRNARSDSKIFDFFLYFLLLKIAKDEKEGIFLHFNIKNQGEIRYGEAEESYGIGNHRG